MIAVLAALVTAAAIVLLAPVRGLAPDAGSREAAQPVDRPLVQRLRPVIAALGFMAGWAFLGGWAGWIGGTLGAVALWVIAGRIEDPAVVRRRELLTADLPVGIDLLAACLASGSSLESSLPQVAAAVKGPVAVEFNALHQRLRLGVTPQVVWGDLEDQVPEFARFGRTMLRSIETGAPVQASLSRLAGELAYLAVADSESRARSVEVKAAAPLGACLLPAFVVLGIVPMVAGLFSTMSMFR